MVAPHALKWRGAIEHKHGRSVAHKTLKVWRALWNVTLGAWDAGFSPVDVRMLAERHRAAAGVE
jgi:hypothetical protein